MILRKTERVCHCSYNFFSTWAHDELNSTAPGADLGDSSRNAIGAHRFCLTSCTGVGLSFSSHDVKTNGHVRNSAVHDSKVISVTGSG